MTLEFIIEDAIANPVKFTLDSKPSDVRASFDQRRYAQVKNAGTDEGKTYDQQVEKTDIIRHEFYSNLPLNRIRVVDCDGLQYGPTITPTVIVEYRNRKYRSSCKLSSIDGKLFLYFSDTVLYLDEDFTETGAALAMDGRLPNINAKVGDVVRYSLDGSTFSSAQITSKVWNTDLQAEGYLLDVDLTLTNPVDGLCEITYDEKPANLYAATVLLMDLDEGRYFLKREHGITDYGIKFTSEPLSVKELHADSLALVYRHNGKYNRPDLWNYVYQADWTNILRIPADFYKFVPAGELEVDVNDTGVPRILRGIPYRQIEISFYNMPSWLADKVQIALSHDYKEVNEYEYEIDSYGNFEMIDRIDLGTYTVTLRQKNDRTKKTDTFSIDLFAQFSPPLLEPGAAGGVLTSVFETNAPGAFRFSSLPPWIVADKPTFVNGDVISFTVAANAAAFPRSEILIAVTDTIPDLEGELTISQALAEPTEPEFVEVDTNPAYLEWPSGSERVITVNSSSDFSIAQTGPFMFTVVKEGTNIRITAPSGNETGFTRVGNVRVSLISNAAVFVDLAVSQDFKRPKIIGFSPNSLTVGRLAVDGNVTVSVDGSAQWQASSPDLWLTFSRAIHTGSDATFDIHVGDNPLYNPPRVGSITVTNIEDPTDFKVLTIFQTDM